MNQVVPRRPSRISEYTVSCLNALVSKGLGDRLSICGAFGLMHYVDYRETHDVDAWWLDSTTSAEEHETVRTLEGALRAFGEVRVRRWGDVVSVELQQDRRTVFSFQVARSSARLEPAQPAPWIPVCLDSLPDLVSSKMVALVERGAPRDFRDIFTICSRGVLTAQDCWGLWRERQHLAGSDADSERARLAVETHLSRLSHHRPLDRIPDPVRRAEAAQVRAWFKKEFLDALR